MTEARGEGKNLVKAEPGTRVTVQRKISLNDNTVESCFIDNR